MQPPRRANIQQYRVIVKANSQEGGGGWGGQTDCVTEDEVGRFHVRKRVVMLAGKKTKIKPEESQAWRVASCIV